MKRPSRGFTIVEVMLFLGITGLLVLIIFTGSGMLARQTRFSDSVYSLQSFVQRQYDEVVNGVNLSENAPLCAGGSTVAGARNCLLVGKLIQFGAESGDLSIVRSSSIVTRVTDINDSTVPEGGTIYQKIAALNPETVSPTDYEINWGARFSGGKAKSGATINAVAFVRNPYSSQIYTYLYNHGPLNLHDALGSTPAQEGSICINNPDDLVSQAAAIRFVQGTGAVSIDTNFSPEGSEC